MHYNNIDILENFNRQVKKNKTGFQVVGSNGWIWFDGYYLSVVRMRYWRSRGIQRVTSQTQWSELCLCSRKKTNGEHMWRAERDRSNFPFWYKSLR